jgi:signal transduction histidine kinase/ligand-binding sensor domain-containing protein
MRSSARSAFFPLVLALLCLFNGTASAERLPVKIFNAADGLGSSFVDYLAPDSRGFMWFCTRDGLSRFDGSQFVTYHIMAKNSPPGIENIYEAHDGTYWITSVGGLFRFDPNTLSAPNETAPTLNAERISGFRGQLYEDRQGNFWMGSNVLYRMELNDGKFDLVHFKLGLTGKPNTAFSVTDIAESSDNSLWVYSTWGLIRKLPDGRLVYYPDTSLSDVPVGALRIVVDSNDLVWVLYGNLVYVIKPDAITSLPVSQQIITKPLVPNKIFQIQAEGQVTMPTTPGEIVQFRNPDFIDQWFGKQIFQSSDGTVWITAENSLLEFAKGLIHVHTVSEGLPNVMSRMAEDSVGNLWIASQSGLARLDRKGLITFGKADGADSDRFLAINEGPDGVMYFASPNAFLNRFNGHSLESIRPGIEPNVLHLWTSRTTFLDSNQNWWILTANKLYRFDHKQNFASLDGARPSATYSQQEGLKSNGIFQIFEDSRKNIWVSTRGADATGHGVAILRAGESRFVAFTADDGLPDGRSATSYVEDKNGNIWMGFYEGGVARFDGERFHIYDAESGLPTDGYITDLHIDTRGRLWISSAAGGLLRVDDVSAEIPEFKQITTADGLTSNNVRTITEDHFGRIYVGTARGVDRLSPDTGQVKHYSMADGLGADFVVDSHCDRDGNLWFATNNGVSRLVPTTDVHPEPPKIWLGGLRIAGELHPSVEFGSSELGVGELSSWQNNLQIDFFGIELRAGEVLRYQYKLEGADDNWSSPSESRTVHFANLQPGGYKFLVRAVNSEGVASDVPAILSFKILSPIWLRWWFLTLLAVAIALIIIGIYRYRLASLHEINAALLVAKNAESDLRFAREQQIQELESVRTRIATDLHDDIGASLTQIAVLSEVAQTQAGAENGGPPEALRKITDVSNELIGIMSDIVWAINPAKDHLSDLTQRMRRIASDVLSPKGVLVHFRSREEDKRLIIRTNIRREVFLIFKESINNVAKHSGAKNVHIDVEITDDLLRLRVQDDGSGFMSVQPSFDNTFSADGPSGNGIRNMQKRAKELGGTFDIASVPGNGTTLILILPLEQNADVTVEPNLRIK